jgi:peroxiredoxin
MRILTILIIFAGMATGNFTYQCWFMDIPDYKVAFDRTFFQGVAIFILAVSGMFDKRLP